MIVQIQTLTFEGVHAVPAFPGAAPQEYAAFGSLDDIAAPWAGEHFRQHLLDHVEQDTVAMSIRRHRLCAEASDHYSGRLPGIIDELGPAAPQISFRQFWYLLSILSRDARYVAYIGRGETVFGVQASWIYKGRQTALKSLYIESGELDRPYSWGPNCQVLSL